MKLVKPSKARKSKKAEIVFFSGLTRLNIPADQVLSQALGKLDGVVIAGFDKDGDTYFASSYADGGNCLWLIEKLKKQLLEFKLGE